MRTASGRARGLLAFLVLALSAAWVLLRRRSGTPAALVAVPSAPPDRRSRESYRASAGPTDPSYPTGAAGTAADDWPGQVPGDVLATDAGLTAEPSAPEPLTVEPAVAGEAPDAVLGTDAGLTAEPTTAAQLSAFSDAPTAEIPLPVPPTPAGADDLRALRGIGRSIERILHELDITTYRQIAELDGAELERVRDALPDFRARIEREDWIGQARELHRQKYGEAP